MDTKKSVLCPWCGAEMKAAVPGVHKRLGEPYDIYCSTFYVCHGCGATGPRTEVIIGDDDGLADKTRECMEKAYTDALCRPLQKPLELHEASDRRTPVWMEGRNGMLEMADVVNVSDAQRFAVFFFGQRNHVVLSEVGYGETWRCWATKPTDEERQAAAWKC